MIGYQRQIGRVTFLYSIRSPKGPFWQREDGAESEKKKKKHVDEIRSYLQSIFMSYSLLEQIRSIVNAI